MIDPVVLMTILGVVGLFVVLAIIVMIVVGERRQTRNQWASRF
ncbi:MAG: hypothetical protein ACE5H4_11970 [Candidatus Thorarchaeota archaeon]